MADHICDKSAVELAGLIADKTVSPVEVVDAALARIDEVQPILNAFCFIFHDEARALARDAEAAIMRGDALGPLHGVPIAIKDFTPTKGKVTTRGSFAFENWVPDFDPAIVSRLRNAGSIMVGKTTTPEFAYSSFTRSPLWGTTRNPWNPQRCTGGSSGGSGAAVASRCVPLAEGTDMGGSVRIPAALCGTVGLKPSLGRIPMDILPWVFDSISHFGPLARTVEDAALFLRLTEGPLERDIRSQIAPIPLPAHLDGDVAGKRFALSVNLGFYVVDGEVAANLHRVADALRGAGAIVEEVDLPWTARTVTAWSEMWGVYLAAAFEHVLPEFRDKMDPDVVATMEAGQKMRAVDFKNIEAVRSEQWFALAKVFESYDALLCPTMAQPAPSADGRDADWDEIDGEGRLHGLDMTSVFNNLAECPALSVPSGLTADGLPTAIQIVGHRFDDPAVLNIGAAVEKLCPWAGRKPPILEK
jgi:Asp-tRNA(Asn)/Glu-tRNA(Gln) amidotransferase A subunit family amidase